MGHGWVSLLGALWVPCVGAIARYIMSGPMNCRCLYGGVSCSSVKFREASPHRQVRKTSTSKRF